MKVIFKIFFVLFLSTSCLPLIGQSEEAPSRKDRKEEIQKLRKEIEAIKEDPNLSLEEKEKLVSEKRADLRSKSKKRGKGKFLSEETRSAWKENMKERKEEIQAIKNDPQLSDEEKEKLIKEKRKEFPKAKKRKRKGGRMGTVKGAKVKEIVDDPNLTDEQKREKIRELRSAKKDKFKGDGKARQERKEKVKEKIEKDELSPKQKKRALKQVKKQEKRLAKSLKKGEITKEKYDSRLLEIQEMKNKLEQ